MTCPDIIQESMRLASAGKNSEAKKILISALEQNQDEIEILNALGDMGFLSHELDDALYFYERSLRVFLQQSDILFNIALIYKEQGNLIKALEAYTKILDMNPNDVESLNNRGNIFRELSFFEKAYQDLNKANELITNKAIIIINKIEPWVIYLNLGNVLILMGRYEEANIFFDKGLELNRLSFELQKSKGVALLYLARYQESIKHSHKALDLNPHDIEIQFDMALAYLSMGDYDEGLKRYETRADKKELSGIIWTGQQDILGKIVYIKAEQGLGDMIQFSRYVPLVSEMGAEVYFQVPKSLQSVMRSLGDQIRIVDEMKSDFDFYVHLMSLPFIFKTNPNNIPVKERYFFAETNKIAFWKKKLNKSEHFQVGLVWHGGARERLPHLWHINRYRDIACEFLKPLFQLDIDLVSLQKGDKALNEMKVFLNKHTSFRIKKYSDEIKDFSDTAALIENLDLVISVDTSVAHLAASLGKETWLLNRFNSCWRWISPDKTRTQWYPTMKIFNQTKLGEWDDVIENVKKNLEERIK
jgi:tetratricopeptide (TPR) repeat protein